MLSRLIEERRKNKVQTRCGMGSFFFLSFFSLRLLLSAARKRPEAFCWPQQLDNKLSWTSSRTGREGERKKNNNNNNLKLQRHIPFSSLPLYVRVQLQLYSTREKIINRHDSIEQGESRWPACSFPMTFCILLSPILLSLTLHPHSVSSVRKILKMFD